MNNLELAREMLIEADLFACEALTMYVHKIGIFDPRKCKNGLDLMEATSQHQQKLRIVINRIEEELEKDNGKSLS